jgi:hypothetical protein
MGNRKIIAQNAIVICICAAPKAGTKIATIFFGELCQRQRAPNWTLFGETIHKTAGSPG